MGASNCRIATQERGDEFKDIYNFVEVRAHITYQHLVFVLSVTLIMLSSLGTLIYDVLLRSLHELPN